MTAGRKPTPTRLKLIAGNPGHRPVNTNEPKPGVKKSIRPPAHLSKAAKQEYRRIAAQLQPLGLLTEIDARALELYADTYALWCEATEKVGKVGIVIKTGTGFPMVNPYLQVAQQASKRMQSLLAEFGMTPSSRSRVSVTKPKENPFDDL